MRDDSARVKDPGVEARTSLGVRGKARCRRQGTFGVLTDRISRVARCRHGQTATHSEGGRWPMLQTEPAARVRRPAEPSLEAIREDQDKARALAGAGIGLGETVAVVVARPALKARIELGGQIEVGAAR